MNFPTLRRIAYLLARHQAGVGPIETLPLPEPAPEAEPPCRPRQGLCSLPGNGPHGVATTPWSGIRWITVR